ncbi:hypothetical protein K437DRAFT_256996 [Tilletiaria anomala UBC 951]|uniref:Uncharacterized protein n=1 Tax=Tilletiaria anomala (strain ATCC 24038 / CBS 436.72 / UBC 951) TaxID=1037660 RepID=A0A066VS55_TILAU|nr:uncharacterized protein K437DRAFT_256996 [Tilletiaria anomala UBC 951]KDN44562.1 hypothetical protein K437DRAFT_256996 [Tilletiaria anomala UBC 951]
MPPKPTGTSGVPPAAHSFQQRRQERMRGTGTSTVTQSSQNFRFQIPSLPFKAATNPSGVSANAKGSGESGQHDAYAFSGSTAGPVPSAASGSPRRIVLGRAGSQGASQSQQQPPRSAMKGGRASVGAATTPIKGGGNRYIRTASGKRRAIEDDENMEEDADDAEAERFEDETPEDYLDASMDLSRTGEKSVSFQRAPPARYDRSASTASSAGHTRSGRTLKQTALLQYDSPITAAARRSEERRKQTGRQPDPPPQRSSMSASTARAQEKEKAKERMREKGKEEEKKKARRQRELAKRMEEERTRAKKAAAAITARGRKRKRASVRNVDRSGENGDDDDSGPEYQVEFDDGDEGSDNAVPDMTLQEDVIIGNRVTKDARRTNGLMAKMMRKRLRRAIRLSLQADEEDDMRGDGDDTSPAATTAPGKLRRRRGSASADKLTDADVIWSIVDAELKAASLAQASSLAASTLKELRSIVRTLFEGLSIKASERRELIAQLDRARSRKKRLRKEVFETRQGVLRNEEEIARIRKETADQAQKAQVAAESLAFFDKLKNAARLWS